MRVTVPTEVAIELERYRAFETLMDDETSDLVLALLVIDSFMVFDND